MNLTTLQTQMIVFAGILALLILVAAALWPMFDTATLAEQEHLDELRHICEEQQRGWDEVADDWNTRGGVFEHHIYPDLFPEALDADAERLARTADLPAVAPLLVPLPQAGSREPDAVYGPGERLPDEPLPEGEIDPRVAAALAELAGDAESTFVRNLYTKPLDEIPGLFSRPLALTAGGSGA